MRPTRTPVASRGARRGWLPVGLIGLGVLAACTAPTLSLRPAPRAFTARDYETVYRAWTRQSDAFSFARLADVLHVTATFQSWEQRWAYVVRYAEDHGLSTEERDRMLRANLEDAREHHRFFVTLAGEYVRESDLTDARSAWRVLLLDDRGNATVPVAIEKVDRPTAADRTYYPTIGRHRLAFRLAFAARRPDGTSTLPDDTSRATLRFTGPRGTVDLVWELSSAGVR
ncbi:MAG: hypothetical protein NZ898_00120 [Myxococcota bacterium]|nr:hypothetical protein [Myxococcota bacterium]